MARMCGSHSPLTSHGEKNRAVLLSLTALTMSSVPKTASEQEIYTTAAAVQVTGVTSPRARRISLTKAAMMSVSS
jgi:hypothetical protein